MTALNAGCDSILLYTYSHGEKLVGKKLGNNNMRHKRGLHTIVSEAIFLSIMLSWLFLFSQMLISNNQTNIEPIAVVEPVYCNGTHTLLHVLKPGFINLLNDGMMYAYDENSTTFSTLETPFYADNNVLLLAQVGFQTGNASEVQAPILIIGGRSQAYAINTLSCDIIILDQ